MRTNMTLAQIIKLRTNNGRKVADFLLDVMQDRYSDFRICHRLQAARLLTTYGNEDAPDFIDDNPRETRSNRSRPRPSRPTKFDIELARLIREDTDDGRSIARFLANVMEGEFASFRPHHRMSAARELLDRGFGKSARNEPTVHPEPVEGPGPSTDDNNEIIRIPESQESQFRQSTDTLVHPESVEGPTPTLLNRPPLPQSLPRTRSGGEGWGEGENPFTTQPHLTPHSSPLTPGQSTDLLDDIDCERCHCLDDIDCERCYCLIDDTPDTPDHHLKPDRNHHTHHT